MRLATFAPTSLILASVVNAGSANMKRDQVCSITSPDGIKTIHCRSCPHLSCSIVANLPVGDKANFSSYATGDCYEGNCTWDYTPEHQCFVNGYYTTSNCNHNDLALTVLSSTTSPSSQSTGLPQSTSTFLDTSFGPTTTFNPAATATSMITQTPSATTGSSSNIAIEKGICAGLGFAAIAFLLC
ncbi:hypothetical protein BGW36DRAFT_75956 [Talaromyces proteolyticus]|uniref:Uncharacterized protein n=1 Tax=Talaromyces proteolyticus TaxID=1131652 RepID=A0AAD4KI95_9EURO|nr:uncharacterized protein BGW36DRAFT_75956 [Talaromyces proteolyticus]KAH8688991.1 hypothetical protein BGW36DRAFT_75956 [Talaromyces proteolyticus]